MADDLGTAIRLLEEALHLRMNGERAPGGNENWREWERRAETFLRSQLTQAGANPHCPECGFGMPAHRPSCPLRPRLPR